MTSGSHAFSILCVVNSNVPDLDAPRHERKRNTTFAERISMEESDVTGGVNLSNVKALSFPSVPIRFLRCSKDGRSPGAIRCRNVALLSAYNVSVLITPSFRNSPDPGVIGLVIPSLHDRKTIALPKHATTPDHNIRTSRTFNCVSFTFFQNKLYRLDYGQCNKANGYIVLLAVCP